MPQHLIKPDFMDERLVQISIRIEEAVKIVKSRIGTSDRHPLGLTACRFYAHHGTLVVVV